MEQRLFPSWSHLWRDALIALTATLVYVLIQYIVSTALPDVLVLFAAAFISLILTLTADVLSRRHALRCAVYTFSQRWWAYLLPAALASCVSAGVLALALFWRGISPVTALVTASPLVLAQVAAICVAVGGMVWLGFFVRDRVTLTATHCYVVLRRVIRQWATGRYVFDYGATRTEIRQESRFLDYLARRSHGRIKRKYGGYVFQGGRDAQVALKQICAGMLSGELAEAIACANAHWERGNRWHNRWRRAGKPAFAPQEQPPAQEGPQAEEKPRTRDFFGNNLDKLFNGGEGFQVRMSDGPDFLTMVIKGQPGAGKSTQALQLCVTLAQQGHYCLYYSIEEERESLLQTARNFRWAGTTRAEKGYAGVRHLDFQARDVDLSRAGVWVSSLGNRAMAVTERKRQLHAEWQQIPQVPSCVVIDSLEGFANVGLDRENPTGVPRAELLALKDFFRDRCQLLIIIVEDDGSGKPGYVDFIADAVLQLGREVSAGYTLLFAEILKARNQSHALGRHLIRIRSQDDIERASGPVREGLRGLTPGIIVYPSLHYLLFQTQHRPTTADYFLSSGLNGLDQMLPGMGLRTGVRRQSALALLGPSGTGKSVIALNFLVEGVRENTPAMLVLLHNDPATITTRSIPQEPHRMHFSWETARDPQTGAERMYHQFAWTVDGIARWWDQRNALSEAAGQPQVESPATVEEIGRALPSLLRLPYLFRLGPLAYPITREELPQLLGSGAQDATERMLKRRLAVTQALAVRAFLRALAGCCPPAGLDGEPRWDAPARRRLRETFAAAWSRLVLDVGADALARAKSADEPKRIHLMHAGDEADETSPAPYLSWDSRTWDPHLPGTGGQGGTHYDTSLLVIREYRPGNITPEDFVDRMLREIGDPKGESIYERVVFDDVSQISQRFPLLADSKMFLPTLIDLFKATGITSLFLADTESNGPTGQDGGITIMADQMVRTSVQYVVNGELAQRGRYSQREIIAEVDARPGDARHAPHILRFTEIPNRFATGEPMETQVALMDLPGPHSGGLPPISTT